MLCAHRGSIRTMTAIRKKGPRGMAAQTKKMGTLTRSAERHLPNRPVLQLLVGPHTDRGVSGPATGVIPFDIPVPSNLHVPPSRP